MATDAAFGPDGTQDPLPPPVFPDPLSGLVAGELFVTELPQGAAPRVVRPQVVLPTSPDPDVLAAVVAEEATRRQPPPHRRSAPRRQPVRNPGAPGREPDVYRPTDPTDFRPAGRARPARTPARRSGGLGRGMAILLLVGVVAYFIVFYVLRGIAESLAGLFR